MEIKLAQTQDIHAWMALVEQVRDVFPGLETAEAMEEHRATVLRLRGGGGTHGGHFAVFQGTG